jgi:hypothetical protein
MRWLKHMLTVGLLLAAGVLALAAVFSDHSDEYGKVALPSGGVVHLPEGTVTVFEHQGVAGLGFQVVSVSRGTPIPMRSAGGTISANGVQRSEVVGEHGAIAKLDVPVEGDYRVVATSEVPAASASLQFGTNAATVVADKWKLLAGLVIAAFLIALIPTPRHKRRSHDDSSVASDSAAASDSSVASTGMPPSPPRAPYAG